MSLKNIFFLKFFLNVSGSKIGQIIDFLSYFPQNCADFKQRLEIRVHNFKMYLYCQNSRVETVNLYKFLPFNSNFCRSVALKMV